ncbi:polysaccharide biosynthesis/export family protein [Lichenihabitans sp. Uapishka_5]|uniref:polysaccharide biosynthesis/export family protein n=1 Tax=Lichenihabitans sp. Uapishka_5 TaxID=3037302 RepID=UPI0029E7F666|nr:polysaccharide biosynthesis/export family protein [Lichenihabitans sp. Uapishka_5]MDX7950406.1 polysaccharide biosynthesis/export family protein [Lichenihabitans sp. Uapishka_5]
MSKRIGMGLGRIWIGAIVLCLAAYTSAWAAGHRLVPSDTVQIKVVNQGDLDTQARVEQDGTITFPYVGRLRVSGMTEDQVANIIKTALERADVVKQPQVLVSLLNFGAQVSVSGSVQTPGLLSLDRPTTLSQVIARAGGVRETAGNVVTVRRPNGSGEQVSHYDLKDIESGKLNGSRIVIQNGDEVYVEAAPVYFLYGYVARAGQYPLARHLSVQQALAAGGGISELGSESRIKIRRRDASGHVVESDASLDDDIRPDDTLVVNERFF